MEIKSDSTAVLPYRPLPQNNNNLSHGAPVQKSNRPEYSGFPVSQPSLPVLETNGPTSATPGVGSRASDTNLDPVFRYERTASDGLDQYMTITTGDTLAGNDRSLEELRVADYAAGRTGPMQQTGDIKYPWETDRLRVKKKRSGTHSINSKAASSAKPTKSAAPNGIPPSSTPGAFGYSGKPAAASVPSSPLIGSLFGPLTNDTRLFGTLSTNTSSGDHFDQRTPVPPTDSFGHPPKLSPSSSLFGVPLAPTGSATSPAGVLCSQSTSVSRPAAVSNVLGTKPVASTTSIFGGAPLPVTKRKSSGHPTDTLSNNKSANPGSNLQSN
ncbi:hypothetical protein BDW02DRAFT_596022 [Decorospora gaudefroyi]|uniref:Uncharacterized protein n=1 Tax=Decorospora gaudefroyi TaxID=184978 RepID=A0A6A5KT87_9PLEO|nr:hypothetical protein BDW02DRAFT_596022 [Decorospora gaudefroyi]